MAQECERTTRLDSHKISHGEGVTDGGRGTWFLTILIRMCYSQIPSVKKINTKFIKMNQNFAFLCTV